MMARARARLSSDIFHYQDGIHCRTATEKGRSKSSYSLFSDSGSWLLLRGGVEQERHIMPQDTDQDLDNQ